MACCGIFDTFDADNLLLKEYTHWKLVLRNRNKTLGNCVAILKRHIEAFKDITDEEMQEFAYVVRDIEHATKQAFDYDIMNYNILMLGDKHLHYHIIPRYAKPIIFAGVTWTDDWWPKPAGTNKEPVPANVLQLVQTALQKQLNP